jgi:3-methyladenine DNA glycosylase/8-oxoguanine DNA glycosylase
MPAPATFAVSPLGPFDLLFQNQFFNPWPTVMSDPDVVVMAFPVEGWSGSAGVTLRQTSPHTVQISVHPGTGIDPERARDQALAAISLDVDGAGWPAVGQRDRVLGALQAQYRCIRPSMFHSPYEAAAAFVIGHRISVAQTRIIRARIAESHGDQIEIDGQRFAAFPGPERLLEIGDELGLNVVKVSRLRGIAAAAIDGVLDRGHLRSMSEPDALALLQTLDGVGPFFAQGILYRGAGIVDGAMTDPGALEYAREAYGLGEAAGRAELTEIVDGWAPYRSWATTLLHMTSEQTHRRTAPARGK